MDPPSLQENIENTSSQLSEHIDIKIEPSEHTLTENQNVMVQIKVENEHLTDQPSTDNDYLIENLQVKDEISTDFDKNASRRMMLETDLADTTKKEMADDETESDHHSDASVKQEMMMMMDDSLVSYDYPNFEDSQSMDSNDVAVLGNVETCLQEEIHIKSECQEGAEDQQRVEFGNIHESELVTETHLISNKLFNTTSTVTNAEDGLIESRTTNTLVMEILPMQHGAITVPFTKMGNPEEILPTTYNTNDMHCEDLFQLNSITGNVLSLEQEAYGLLKAKKLKTIKPVKIHPCLKCHKEYSSRAVLNRHMAVHQSIEKRAKGVIKGQQTKIANRKKQAALDNRWEIEVPAAPNIKTEGCDVEVKQEIKKEGYECTCGKVFQRRSRMETCLRSHNIIYSETNPNHQCSTCLRNFTDKNDLACHRKRAHRKRFHCKFCPTDYNTRKELFKHLQIHQKVQLMEYKVISEVVHGKQKIRCFMCEKSYSELSELKSHVMEDHKSPFTCLHCRNTFARIIDFGDHVKTYHPDVEGQSVLDVLEAFSMLVKAWKCEDCGLQFHEADKLAIHQIEQHSPDVRADPQFQCIDCRRVFISQKGLTSHRRIHHSETVEETEPAVKGIMCLECRKICKDMDALTSHMRLHSMDRKFPCKFCDFRFSSQEKKKAHAELHTGDMKYVCFICEYQCSSENRLKQHKASAKHLSMKEYLASGQSLVEEQSTSQTVKKDKKKKDPSVTDEGGGNTNSGSDEEVACDICGDSFESESAMLEHKQTHPFIEFPNDDKPSRIFFK